MRKILLALLTALVLEHAPVRLMVVSAQALVTPAGYNRLDTHGVNQLGQVKDLELRLMRFGWRIEYVAGLIDAQGVYGLTHAQGRLIQVDKSLNWNARFAVLAHEGGHTLQPSFMLSPGQSEIFAESVALLVEGGGHRRHARYLAMWRADLLTTVVYWREIYAAAALLR